MIVLVGKTASGKTSVLNKMLKRGYESITTYTTRPRRRKEPKDAYHFISEEEFLQKIKSDFFAEWSSYTTTKGKWYYGSAREDYINASDNTVVILNPYGLNQIKNTTDIHIKSIYIYANLNTIKERLNQRGDSKAEIDRRIQSDIKDFKNIPYEVDKIVYNNLNNNLDDVVDNVFRVLDLVR